MRRRQPRFLIEIPAAGRGGTRAGDAGGVDRNGGLHIESLLGSAFAGCADLHLG
jgi:hypothetical protein